MRLDVAVQQGQRQTGVLALTNESAIPVRIRADLLDFRIDESASPLFAPSLAGESAYSCRSWLAINPMEFEMSANERRLIRYSLRVPNETGQGSFHCAVGFTAAPPADGSSSIGMRTNVRVIAALYPMVGDVPPEGTIDALAARSNEEAIVTVVNTGQRVFRAAGTIDVLDEAGRVIDSQPLPGVPILPARKQPLPVRFGEGLLARGRRLRVRMDIGGSDIQEASIDLHARP
ncbi:MAG TPA: hypothetical protein VFQ91_03370 [Bryobacteraceae bacterium]|nr:hypothetical protein [Bryobacteraceae bacterium]